MRSITVATLCARKVFHHHITPTRSCSSERNVIIAALDAHIITTPVRTPAAGIITSPHHCLCLLLLPRW